MVNSSMRRQVPHEQAHRCREPGHAIPAVQMPPSLVDELTHRMLHRSEEHGAGQCVVTWYPYMNSGSARSTPAQFTDWPPEPQTPPTAASAHRRQEAGTNRDIDE